MRKKRGEEGKQEEEKRALRQGTGESDRTRAEQWEWAVPSLIALRRMDAPPRFTDQPVRTRHSHTHGWG